MSLDDDRAQVERLEMDIEDLEADRKRLDWVLSRPGSAFTNREQIDREKETPARGGGSR